MQERHDGYSIDDLADEQAGAVPALAEPSKSCAYARDPLGYPIYDDEQAGAVPALAGPQRRERKYCACGRSYCRAEWPMLQYVGVQVVDPDRSDPEPLVQEMRNCVCGSTLAWPKVLAEVPR